MVALQCNALIRNKGHPQSACTVLVIVNLRTLMFAQPDLRRHLSTTCIGTMYYSLQRNYLFSSKLVMTNTVVLHGAITGMACLVLGSMQRWTWFSFSVAAYSLVLGRFSAACSAGHGSAFRWRHTAWSSAHSRQHAALEMVQLFGGSIQGSRHVAFKV
jgi:hypothetical protein